MLASGRSIEEKITFPGNAQLCYALETRDEPSPAASFERNEIRISAPRETVRDWAEGGEIGLYFEFPADGNTLKVAIEKDLECVDGPLEERDPEAFPRAVSSGC